MDNVRQSVRQELRDQLKNNELMECVTTLVSGPMWPLPEHCSSPDNSFGCAAIRQLYLFWSDRFRNPGIKLETLLAEWRDVFQLFALRAAGPGAPMLRHVVQIGHAAFPGLHVLFRSVLAVSPSDVDVERLFSRMANVLRDNQLKLLPSSVERLVVAAQDAPLWSKTFHAFVGYLGFGNSVS
jgi:hypothetical protein